MTAVPETRRLRRLPTTRKLAMSKLLVVALAGIWPGLVLATTTCEARTGPTRTTVVELYTSEGCSSCPPADRWISSLKSGNSGPDALLALAFHVTYWDRLGWADRFASQAHTDRQNLVVTAQGGRVIYTPQVIVNGDDWRGWPRLPKAAGAPPVDLQLSRDGNTFTAHVRSHPGSTPRAQQLTGYWAVLEDGHHTDVRAGENAGASLRHDHVVRAYQPVGVWPVDQQRSWQWRMPDIRNGDGSAATTRRVAFVVADARTQRPVQALALAC